MSLKMKARFSAAIASMLFFLPLCANAKEIALKNVHVINLKCTADTGTFARYAPFEGSREVIVRRGSELGFNYGIETTKSEVIVAGHKYKLTRCLELISPPPQDAHHPPVPRINYERELDVVKLPDMEICIPRKPNGFSDKEVEKILAAVSLKN